MYSNESVGIRVLNRDVIKYIAMAAMFLNHFGHAFLEPGILFEVFQDIGYFTAITMCYFLVEGYSYTRSKKKYALRLLLFAAISQVPYSLFFNVYGLSMIFTLFLCFLILMIRESNLGYISKTVAIVACVFVSYFSDWYIMAALFTLLIARQWDKDKDDKKGWIGVYIICFLIDLAFTLLETVGTVATLNMCEIAKDVLSCVPILVSGFVIIYMYNGKRMERGRTFSKWFFYIFYPAHLTVLVLLRYFMPGL